MRYKLESEKVDSYICDILRFPLTIVVVFLHLPLNSFNIGGGIREFIGWTGGIAVPIFFIISGYFFYYKIEEFNISCYFLKIRRRIRSLILPYFIWNLLAFLFLFVFVLGGVIIHKKNISILFQWFIENFSYHLFYDATTAVSSNNLNWIGNPRIIYVPYLQPFWYIRDLIIMVLISPLIYSFIKNLKCFFVILLMLLYISGINFPIKGLSYTSLFFFSFGAFLAINKITITDFFSKEILKRIASILFIITSLIIISYRKNNISYYFYPIFFISLTIIIFYICILYSKKIGIKNSIVLELKKYSFFIYASHSFWGIYIAELVIKK